MNLVLPRIILLDSSTLGNAARDYWSTDSNARAKARSLLSQILELGGCIGITLTHLIELIRLEDAKTVRDRQRFLAAIPLIAWLRPYDRSWFPGGMPDLLTRELHAIVHGSAKDHGEVIDQVRNDLWETGTGEEMFGRSEHVWEVVAAQARRRIDRERQVASILRTDPAHISNLTIGELLNLPRRSREEQLSYVNQYSAEMTSQLDQHGDPRLTNSHRVAVEFSQDTLRNLEEIESMGGDPVVKIAEYFGVPPDLVTSDTTVDEIGDCAVYIKQLDLLSPKLKPRIQLSLREVPATRLPSYSLQRRLAAIQRRADRVSGSDLGDAHIAPLVHYSDLVEVDKRTFEYITQAARSDRTLQRVKTRFVRSTDYARIPALLDSAVKT